MKRPTSIIILQCIVLLALIISIVLHKIITIFEYFKEDLDTLMAYGLASMQFIAILYFVILSYGLIKRKSFARWGSLLFFVVVLIGYNVFVIILGNGPIHYIKFSIINGISLFYVYQLSFGDTVRQFFWLKVPRPGVKKRLKGNMIFYDH